MKMNSIRQGDGSMSKRRLPVSTTALFTIVKTQHQPSCPSTDEWAKEMWSHRAC